jgi:hypothetical protein
LVRENRFILRSTPPRGTGSETAKAQSGAAADADLAHGRARPLGNYDDNGSVGSWRSTKPAQSKRRRKCSARCFLVRKTFRGWEPAEGLAGIFAQSQRGFSGQRADILANRLRHSSQNFRRSSPTFCEPLAPRHTRGRLPFPSFPMSIPHSHLSSWCGRALRFAARVFPAVLALAALTTTKSRADVVFTRSTTTGEHWAHYTATFTPAYSGNYTLGFNLTAGGPSGDNSVIIDAVTVTNGATTLFADGFETPALATNTSSTSSPGNTVTIGNWAFTNYSGILDGSPPDWHLADPSFTLGSADGTTQYGYIQAAGGTLGQMKAANTLALVAGQTYTISFYQASRYAFGGTTTYTVTLDAPAPVVFASGITPVTGYDPIFPAGPVVPDSAESKPVPTVGYSDPRWVNPHPATVFPKNSHPWEYQSWVPAAFKFDANWINAWSNLDSNGHGVFSPSWGTYPNQSWTKYTTTVVGTGDYVLQFLADNASWIYIDGALVGFQDYNWSTNGTGRYTINLSGASTHELSFVIWDGGGLAGGKFRLETKASFLANNPGATLPPAPASVTLSNLTQTYDGTPKSVGVSTSPGGLPTTVTYNGSTMPPTAAGSYSVVATVTDPAYLGSATGTLTINPAHVSFVLDNLSQTYDGTAKSITVTSSSPSGVAYVINYLGDRINAGNCPVLVVANNPNYTGSTPGTLVIAKANATVSVSGYSGTFDATAHGATGTAKGIGGASLGGLNLGATFVNAPGGTAHWTFSGGSNYNDQSGDVTIAIAKANANVVVAGYTGTYDFGPHGATGTATGVGGANLAAGLNLGATFVNAPGGTAHWTFNGGTNYNDQSGDVAITITKATATIFFNNTTQTYDGTPRIVTTATFPVGTLAVALTYDGSSSAPINAGSYALHAVVNDTNFQGTNDATLVVNPHPVQIIGSNFNQVYDGTPKSLGLALTPDVAHTVTYTLNGTPVATPIDAGHYKVDVKVTDPNYIGSATLDLTVQKATATVVVTPYNVTFDGAAHSATVTSITGVNGETGATVGTVTLNTTHTNAGTYATDSWFFTGGPNYNGIPNTTITDTITKADATVSVVGYTGVFDGALHGATGSATGVNGANLNAGLNLGAKFANFPGGNAHWTFNGGNNYNSQSGDVSIVINKANAVINVSGYTGVYDGAAHGATGTAKGVGGVDLSAALNLGAKFTNAPGGTATWTLSGLNNYNDATGTVDIVVNKADATVVVQPYSVEYDGHSHSATVVSISGVNGETDSTVGAVTLNTTHTLVGVYASDTWSFAGTNNYNDIAATTITDDIHDTTAPVIASVAPSSGTLWPPNHQMVPITLNIAASDLVGVTGYKVTATSSEPDNGLGDGDTANDIQITGNNTLNPVINLRAERAGNGNGRTYTISVQAFDAAGNLSAAKTCTVSVPKSQGKAK